MNFATNGAVTPENDPLGLSELAELKPEPGALETDWKVVSAALDRHEKSRRHWLIGGMAAAASIVFVLTIATIPREDVPGFVPATDFATQTNDTGQTEDGTQSSDGSQQPSTAELIAMSQKMERQLHQVRTQVGGMPSELVVYQVELQDLIGQVDDALSMSPDSEALWGQRLGLQMDLMKLYRNQLRRDYHRMASV